MLPAVYDEAFKEAQEIRKQKRLETKKLARRTPVPNIKTARSLALEIVKKRLPSVAALSDRRLTNLITENRVTPKPATLVAVLGALDTKTKSVQKHHNNPTLVIVTASVLELSQLTDQTLKRSLIRVSISTLYRTLTHRDVAALRPQCSHP